MTDESRVTILLASLREGSDEATTRLWNEFYGDLVRVAQREFSGAPQRAADADDAAAMAIQSCFKRVKDGQFPDLKDRDGLWRLLFTITVRKVAMLMRQETRLKRGGGKVRGESVFMPGDEKTGIDQVAGHQPLPEDKLVLAESLSELLELLTDNEQEIAMLKLENRTNREIADQCQCAVATIERRLRLIRQKWEEAGLKPQ